SGGVSLARSGEPLRTGALPRLAPRLGRSGRSESLPFTGPSCPQQDAQGFGLAVQLGQLAEDRRDGEALYQAQWIGGRGHGSVRLGNSRISEAEPTPAGRRATSGQEAGMGGQEADMGASGRAELPA